MKRFCLLAFLLPLFSNAQVTHSIGVGSYANYSKMTNLSEVSDTILNVNQDINGRINLSPFVEYTFGYNRFNGSVGLGLWHNGTKSTTSASAGFFTLSVDGETRDRSIFVPVSLGYDVVQGNALVVGLRAKAHFRYLTSMYVKASSSSFLGSYSTATTWEGSDLDTLDATRFFVSPGLGLYAGYAIGRFTPLLEVGALYDLQGASKEDSDQNKYLNLYAALTLRFRFYGDKPGALE
jgi:hypothetical protein